VPPLTHIEVDRKTPLSEAAAEAKLPSLHDFFSPGGILARSSLAFEHRPGQYAMAKAIEQAFADRRHLIIEAAGFSVGSVLAVLGIVALWGPDTAAYELLGIGVIAILCALVGAAGAARQDLRTAPKRGADHR